MFVFVVACVAALGLAFSPLTSLVVYGVLVELVTSGVSFVVTSLVVVLLPSFVFVTVIGLVSLFSKNSLRVF